MRARVSISSGGLGLSAIECGGLTVYRRENVAFYQVVAADIDGTLTSGHDVSVHVERALDEVRAAGAQVVLATGRIGAELSAEFPQLARHADALVLENGAVAVHDGTATPLTAPVAAELDAELSARGVSFRRGQVLLATESRHTAAVAEAIGVLGLDCQLIRNRDALMVLPAAVTKGSGLRSVLARMNRSLHNVVAIGDAENDLSMLVAAELGVAVSNAVASVREHADLVLDESDGTGVARLLGGPLFSGAQRWCPMRRWIDIGVFPDLTPARVPGSQGRITVTGPAGSGKSYLIGLLAERWILAGYAVLVVDPEGDHVELKTLDNVAVVDSHHYLPDTAELIDMLHPGTSVIVDLSALTVEDKHDYVHRLRPLVEARRERHGFPHWVIYDEAHLLGPQEEQHWMRRGGYVLSSFTPAVLPAEELEDSDVVLETRHIDRRQPTLHTVQLATVRYGNAEPRPFTVAQRTTVHTRHRHKYADVVLPHDRRFYFRPVDAQVIPPAGTMRDFATAVHRLAPEALQFHLERGDFSRWLSHIVADDELAGEMTAWEDEVAARRAADVERVRQQIVSAVHDRYLGTADDA